MDLKYHWMKARYFSISIPRPIGFVYSIIRVPYRWARSYFIPHPRCWNCRWWVEMYGEPVACKDHWVE